MASFALFLSTASLKLITDAFVFFEIYLHFLLSTHLSNNFPLTVHIYKYSENINLIIFPTMSKKRYSAEEVLACLDEDSDSPISTDDSEPEDDSRFRFLHRRCVSASYGQSSSICLVCSSSWHKQSYSS